MCVFTLFFGSINRLRFVEIFCPFHSRESVINLSMLFVQHECSVSDNQNQIEEERKKKMKTNVAKINLRVDFSPFNFQLCSILLFSHFNLFIRSCAMLKCSVQARIFRVWHLSVVFIDILSLQSATRIYFGHFCKWFILLCDSPSLSAFKSRLGKWRKR